MSILNRHYPLFDIIKIVSPAIIIYGIFITVRLAGMQPASEPGMGDFITAVYFIFGASVVYMMFFFRCLGLIRASRLNELWCYSVCAFLMFLAYDETFMIHENLSRVFHIREVIIFMTYGAVLMILVYCGRKNLTHASLWFLIGFIALAGIAVISDTFFGEGIVILFDREIDFEQLAESIAALSLSSVFVSIAYHDTVRLLNQNHIKTHEFTAVRSSHADKNRIQ